MAEATDPGEEEVPGQAREQEDVRGGSPSASLPQPLVNLLSQKMGEDTTEEALEEMTQKDTSFKFDQNNHKLLSNLTRECGSVREVARLASVGLPHAGDWLNVVPCPALGLHLRSQEFITVTKYRLGANIYQTAGQCPACGNHSDCLGDHAMCCSSNGERISRHNILRDALYAAAQSAALGPSKEGWFLLPGTDRRPADVLIPHWAGGKDAALDVTVINPLQVATVAEAAVSPGLHTPGSGVVGSMA